MRYRILFLTITAASAWAQADLLNNYCTGCHGAATSEAGVVLTGFSAEQVAQDPAKWERVVRQLRAGTMPPVGSPRPQKQVYADAIAALAAQLDRAKPASLHPAEGWQARLKQDQLVDDFFVPWLRIDRLATQKVNAEVFPEVDDAMRAAMLRETKMFLADQLRRNRPMIELWTAARTFVNEQLAKHYGIVNVKGADFRQVSVSKDRAGLLGQGSILTITSHPDSNNSIEPQGPSTSPAGRGKWIRSHYFGADGPMPAPNVPPQHIAGSFGKGLRLLPASPCTNCHRNFFPLGYGLDNFDAVGRWRTMERGDTVDASGALVDGTPYSNGAEMRAALLKYQDAAIYTLTERLMMFAAGGKEAITKAAPPEMMPAVRQVVRDAAKKGDRWSAILDGIAAQLKQ